MNRHICCTLAGLTFVWLAGCSENGSDVARSDQKTVGRNLEWRLAVMTYTFNRFTLLESIDKTRQLGVNCLETFAWQQIGGPHGAVQFNSSAPDDALDDVKKKLDQAGIDLVNYYESKIGTNEARSREIFEFCRKMGIKAIICEPPTESLDLLDRLAGQYEVKIAIHNHPKNDKRPEYRNWDPANVMAMLEGHSHWLGTCADTGHWVRSGLDPVKCLKTYDGRLISLHLKDVDKAGPEGHDVPWGTGVADAEAMLKQLKKQRFSGVISIEYEANMEDNMADVAQCVAYFRGLKKKLGVR